MASLDLEEAEAWLTAGRAAEALMAAETLLAGGQGHAAGLRDRALAAIQAMDPQFAALQLAAAVHADSLKAQLDLGHAWLLQDRLADAERCFRQALTLDSGSAEAHASLGVVYHRAGIGEGAEHHSRQALALDDAHVVASQTLAAILLARGEAEAARSVEARAYGRQSLFVQAVAEPRLRVLVLATVSTGNVPYKAIMPPTRYSRLVWYMEYAREADRPAPDAYDVVFNAIGDADLASPSRAAVERFLAVCPKAVLNDPAQVRLTRRDATPERLGGLEGVVVPRTVRLGAAEIADRGLAALAAAAGLEGPLLVRPIGSHGGQGLLRAAEPADLERIAPAPGVDHYLTAYADFRSADGLFRKYRVLFVDRRPFPYHEAISDGWLVHHETSGMTAFAERRAEEARFLADPAAAVGEPAMAALTRIGRTLDLDYAGVDFAVLPDGRVLVFEANATMLAHHEEPGGPFAYKNPYVDAITGAFQALLARRAGRAESQSNGRW